MLFFSFTIAPIIFKSLDEKNARNFIRSIFPYYYFINLILSILVIIFFVSMNFYGLNFYLILSVAILFAFSQFILMPMINKYRDNNETKKFNYTHGVSVVINIIQMVFLVIILI
ncbi:DUF4149 domain-containing protein [Candidatus Pelagibacter sp.]|uniref:DUF4149 domain-containing protein n=1 Tax=Candidatus Pelagibacter sp. TaxID=2024849 RepID=UPI003F82B162